MRNHSVWRSIAGVFVAMVVIVGYLPFPTGSSAATAAVLPVLSPVPVPTITGTAKVGSTLTAVPGTWGPAPVTLAYQWRAGGVAILAGVKATYVPVAADAGKTLTVTVTGTKSGYATTAKTSAATAAVLPVLSPVPVPTITGTAKVGSTLTAVPGTWGPAPVTLAYQWRAGGVAILAGVKATYVPVAADAGKTLTVTVTGTKSGYATTAKTSAATAAVLPVLSPVPVPTITGTAKVGSTLTAVPGTWGPAPVTLAYQWRAGGVAILAGVKATYVPVAADAGKTLTVTVTGTKSGYATTAKTSAATAAVLPVLSPVPVPTITGTAKVGSTLTAVPGTWGPAPVTLAYQWRAGGVAILAGVKATYVPVAADAGKTLTVTVTGTKSGYATTAKTSAATAAVLPVLSPVPVPTITGTAKVGSTLTAVPGTWGPAPVTLAYQWRAGGVAILAGVKATYVPVAADAGKTLTVTVTGTKSGYATTAKTSAATAAVAALPLLSPVPVPTITGTAKVGSTLTAVPGTWGPAPVTLAYQWRAGGVAILAGVKATYVPVAADAGKTLTVTVTGTKSGYATTAKTSAATAAVLPVLSPVPVPTITGTAKVGSTLTAVPGTWGPAPVTLAYQWRAGGVAILAGVKATYVPVAADAGKTLTVTVTGTKSGYATTAKTSAATAAVLPVLSPVPVPTITGTAKVGSTLTAVPGTWGPAPVTLAYQWRAGGVAILAGVKATYVPVAADAGKTLTVTVTGTKSGYATTAKTSAATAAVLPVLSPVPVPTITGTAKVGSTLTAVPGTWGPAPVTLAYQWRAGGVAILAGVKATYVPVAADAGKTLTVTVTGTKSGYATTAKTSAATAAVAALPSLSPVPVPTITGTAKVGSTLTAVPGTWGPAPVTLTYQWKAGGVAVIGANLPTLTPTTSMVGKTLTVSVTGTKTGYTTATKTSLATAAVADLAVTTTPIHVSGTLAANATWSGIRTYIVDDTLAIPAGVTLTVAAGTVVKFRGGDLDVSGAVAVNGTTAAPVTFTSYQDDSAGGDTNGDGGASTPASGGWGGISVNTAASLTATRLAQKYGSSGISANPGAGTVSVIDSSLTDNLGGGIYVRRWEGYENRLSKITITGNTLTRSGNIDVRSDNTAADAAPIQVKNNQVSGLTDTTEPYLLFDARTRPSNLTGNTASGNKVNAIMLGGILVENWTMPTTGAPYVISGSLSVPAGVTLTVAAGTVVKFRGGDLDVSGAVAVNGTTAAPVTFTSYQDDSAGGDTNGDGGASTPASGGWGGISVTLQPPSPRPGWPRSTVLPASAPTPVRGR